MRKRSARSWQEQRLTPYQVETGGPDQTVVTSVYADEDQDRSRRESSSRRWALAYYLTKKITVEGE